MNRIDELLDQTDFTYRAQPPAPSRQHRLQTLATLEIARQLERIADALKPQKITVGEQIAQFEALVADGESEDVAAWLTDLGTYPI